MSTQTTSALDAAREYTRRGERVVPVPRGQKEPVITGWPDLRLTEQDLPGISKAPATSAC